MHVHVACALWTPEVRFQHPENLSGIDLTMLTASRISLICSMCNQVGQQSSPE